MASNKSENDFAFGDRLMSMIGGSEDRVGSPSLNRRSRSALATCNCWCLSYVHTYIHLLRSSQKSDKKKNKAQDIEKFIHTHIHTHTQKMWQPDLHILQDGQDDVNFDVLAAGGRRDQGVVGVHIGADIEDRLVLGKGCESAVG